MKRFVRRALLLLIIAFAAAVSFSCVKEEKPGGKATVKACSYLTNNIMRVYYYWYDTVPRIEYTTETDIYEYFDALLYEKDRWSWMIDGPSFIASESGVVYGSYGASLSQIRDPENFEEVLDYNVFVRYVYPDSPFDKAGVKRGWKLSGLDGHSVIDYWLSNETNRDGFNELIAYPSTTTEHTFTFVDGDGQEHTFSTLAAEELVTRPCLSRQIFTAADYPGLTEPVGYYNYLAFKADDDINGKSLLDDISEPMEYFRQNNVKTIIVDLRYNGGGDSRASDLFVGYLAPKSADKKVFVNRMHNDKFTKLDLADKVDVPDNSPDFKSIYFITSKGSASASEMTLNGLKPLANVHHVGGVTYGKPNGMYVFYYPDLAAYKLGNFSGLKYVFLPICFYNCNGNGDYIPDDGIVPDNIRPDDLYHDFGVTEDNIAACLYHIVHGSYPQVPEYTWEKPETKAGKKGSGILLTEEEMDKNYGKYIVNPDFL